MLYLLALIASYTYDLLELNSLKDPNENLIEKTLNANTYQYLLVGISNSPHKENEGRPRLSLKPLNTALIA
ncbi:MAG: hypothetical protein KGO93_05050 [Cyanobacteria bacterium REEB446]|nr:hypothetical protein [Cyanobacteria bacterium REEB446]